MLPFYIQNMQATTTLEEHRSVVVTGYTDHEGLGEGVEMNRPCVLS